jgi:hypothetical protein
MNSTDLLALYDDVMRRNTVVAGHDREQTPFVSRFTTRTGTRRMIIWHGLSPIKAAAIVDAEWALARDCTAVHMWKLYRHDAAHDEIRDALLARGYREKDHSTLMTIDVNELLATLPSMPHSINVRQLTTPESLDAYQEIWDEVWPEEPNASYVDDYRALLRENDPGIVLFAGFAEGNVAVTTGYLFHHPGEIFALLCGGTTKTKWRGQRAYTSTLIARATVAKARGVEYLAVEASPESEPILKRLGFVELSKLAFYEYDFEKIRATTASIG